MASGRDKINASAPTAVPGKNIPRELPTHQEIELAAYQLYLERGGMNGTELDDWLQAERELMEQFESEAGPRTKAKGA
jgi:hypothetical protein